MSPDAALLRERARTTLQLARASSSPQRASQLRACAGQFQRRALRLELAAHAADVGQVNVTVASFRAFIRQHRS